MSKEALGDALQKSLKTSGLREKSYLYNHEMSFSTRKLKQYWAGIIPDDSIEEFSERCYRAYVSSFNDYIKNIKNDYDNISFTVKKPRKIVINYINIDNNKINIYRFLEHVYSSKLYKFEKNRPEEKYIDYIRYLASTYVDIVKNPGIDIDPALGHSTSSSFIGGISALVESGFTSKDIKALVKARLTRLSEIKDIPLKELNISFKEKVLAGKTLSSIITAIKNNDKAIFTVTAELESRESNIRDELKSSLEKTLITERYLKTYAATLKGSPSFFDIIKNKIRNAFAPKQVKPLKDKYVSQAKQTTKIKPNIKKIKKRSKIPVVTPPPEMLKKKDYSDISLPRLMAEVENLTKELMMPGSASPYAMNRNTDPVNENYLRYQTGRFVDSVQVTNATKDTLTYSFDLEHYGSYIGKGGRDTANYVANNMRMAAASITRRRFNVIMGDY